MDITEKFRREMGNIEQSPKLDTGVYWWVWGKMIKNGKVTRVLRGPYMSEAECFEAGNSLLGGDFECVSLNTRDEAAASRVMRNRVAEETKDTEATFRRFRHTFLKDRKTSKTQEGGKSAWVGSEDIK